ncbi:MAG: alanine dehydrogenase [Proteobacteria bacterium]|jgi:alanine dehydrogenase|nr:alanine dehydrogenase [Pseudomonadota bacterium]
MKIGVPKEIKIQEYRVGLVPAGVRELTKSGAKISIQAGAGLGSGVTDEEYKKAGATIVPTAEAIWKDSEMVIKVKEPLPAEFNLIQNQQKIYTYLHLAVAPELVDVLVDKKVAGIAYETIEDKKRSLPLLKPMSEVAGKMATQVGAFYLSKQSGGTGVLLGGVPGVRRGKVTIIGGGIVGMNACKIAVGMGADVTILDVNVDRLEYLDDIFGNQITTLKSHTQNIEDSVLDSDLVVGAVLLPGAKAPNLVNREMVSKMKKGAVIVDVAVDQGGCVETCKPTTHENPTYLVDGVIHYCVANMPGAVANTSTFALTNATLGYAKRIVEEGLENLMRDDAGFKLGLNTYKGYVVYEAVAQALNKTYKSIDSLS